MREYRETDEDAHLEMTEMKDALPREVLEALNDNGGDLSDIPSFQPRETLFSHAVSGVSNFSSQVWEMLQEKATRKALILGCGLMWVQQLSGINTVMVSLCLLGSRVFALGKVFNGSFVNSDLTSTFCISQL